MKNELLEEMEQFIVRAKNATYVGSGQKLLPYRLGSTDLQFQQGVWAYHDSYFGESDFIGQEVVYLRKQPVWAMNYYGRLLRPDRITAADIGQMIKASLTKMYAEGRFLGGFEHNEDDLKYLDHNDGNTSYFEGVERIFQRDELVYELAYHGGLIKY
jgi:hypothetical protein